ncbi:hypothetical protein BJX61DRAFT_548562 [Aspergillus egyptiacus]|nr:hypothetical protein BJX61DRAFT_548562 [Aspergillus egyptiacus]
MEDQSPSITGASWSLGAVSLIMVAFRLYARVWRTRRRGWDDFFIALALANALVCSALAEVAVHYGLGRHTYDISDLNNRAQAIKYTVIAPCFSVVSTTTGKISVSIFLLRLIGPAATLFQRWFLYILNLVSIIWNTIAIVAIIGFCSPPKKIWIPDTPGSCFALEFQLIVGTSQAAFNAVADLSLALMPAFIFYRVRLARLKKIGGSDCTACQHGHADCDG